MEELCILSVVRILFHLGTVRHKTLAPRQPKLGFDQIETELEYARAVDKVTFESRKSKLVSKGSAAAKLQTE